MRETTIEGGGESGREPSAHVRGGGVRARARPLASIWEAMPLVVRAHGWSARDMTGGAV